MNKKDVKDILMELRKPENEDFINYMLGNLDMMDDDLVAKMIDRIGNTKDCIKLFLQRKIQERNTRPSDKKFPINKMFTYGISEDCVHLHLPGYLYEMFGKHGFSKSMNIVNMYLLDALDRLNTLKNIDFYRLKDARNILMISPLLIPREVHFLQGMHFSVRSYTKKELSDDNFVSKDPEARLAVDIFGKSKNIGSAMISFSTLNSKEWQYVKNEKMEEFTKKGISIEDDDTIRE